MIEKRWLEEAVAVSYIHVNVNLNNQISLTKSKYRRIILLTNNHLQMIM